MYACQLSWTTLVILIRSALKLTSICDTQDVLQVQPVLYGATVCVCVCVCVCVTVYVLCVVQYVCAWSRQWTVQPEPHWRVCYHSVSTRLLYQHIRLYCLQHWWCLCRWYHVLLRVIINQCRYFLALISNTGSECSSSTYTLKGQKYQCEAFYSSVYSHAGSSVRLYFRSAVL